MEISSLPADWKWATLGDVAQYINGRVFHSSEWSTVGLPIIRIQNLNNTNAEFNYFDGPVSAQHYVETGDLLVSWSASLDVYFWDRLPGALNQHIFKVQENPSVVDKDFLFFTLKYVMKTLRDMAHGGTMTHVTRKVFESTALPLPPLKEQKRIAAILSEQMAAVEKAKKAAEERLEAAKALPAAYLREVFPSNEDEIPDGWEWVKLGDVTDRDGGIVRGPFGGSLKKEIFIPSSDYMVYEQSHAIYGEMSSGRYFVTEDKYVEMSRFQVLPADLIMSCSGTIGKVSIIPRDASKGIINQALLKIRLDQGQAIPEYVRYFLTSPIFTAYVTELSMGTAMANIASAREISQLPIPLPPLLEQQRITSELEEKLVGIELAEESIQQELETIGTMPAALLRIAFSGEL